MNFTLCNFCTGGLEQQAAKDMSSELCCTVRAIRRGWFDKKLNANEHLDKAK